MDIYENYVPQPLPVYQEAFVGDRSRWNRNQCQCEGQDSWGEAMWRLLLTKTNDSALDVPPFHIKRDSGGAAITELWLKSVDGTVDFELTGFSTTINDLDSPLTKEAVVFSAQTYTDIQSSPDDTPLVIDDKEFYLWITDGVNEWYTETFYAVLKGEDSDFPAGCDNCGYIRLLAVNSGCVVTDENGIGVVHNNTPSLPILLNASLTRPEYEFEPDGENDGHGGTTKNFLRVDKLNGFTIVAPEYVADFMALCQIMGTVGIDFPNGDSVLCYDVAVTVEWGQPEPVTNCYATITFKFRAESWIRSGCCG